MMISSIMTRSCRSGRGRLSTLGRPGAAMVEFAFVAPWVFMIIFGIIDFGRIWMVQAMLTETARRACKIAASIQSPQIPARYQPRNWNDYISDYVIAPTTSSTWGITGQVTTVYVVDNRGVDISTAQSASGIGRTYNPGSEITIQVTVPVNNISWVPVSWISGRQLSGQYTLRRE